MQGIYRILHTKSGKVYIGSSKDVTRRMSRYHIALLKRSKHWNRHLQSAWDKYGEGSFLFECIEEVRSEVSLVEREQYWIDHYDAANREHGYNIAPRADRTFWSDEMRLRASERLKGKSPRPAGWKHTQEAKDKIAAAGRRKVGTKHSKATKAKIGDRCRGKTYEALYGKEKAAEIKQKQSRSLVEKVGPERAAAMIAEKSKSYEKRFGKRRAMAIKRKQSAARFKPIAPEIVRRARYMYEANGGHITARMIKELGTSRYKLQQVLHG